MKFANLQLAAAAVAFATVAVAQEVVLYQDDNFNGPRYTANSSVSDLSRVGFNDRASSATIRGGSWQLCDDAFFRGECVTLGPGDYASLSWLSNRISSGRRIANDYPYNAAPRWQN